MIILKWASWSTLAALWLAYVVLWTILCFLWAVAGYAEQGLWRRGLRATPPPQVPRA